MRRVPAQIHICVRVKRASKVSGAANKLPVLVMTTLGMSCQPVNTVRPLRTFYRDIDSYDFSFLGDMFDHFLTGRQAASIYVQVVLYSSSPDRQVSVEFGDVKKR